MSGRTKSLFEQARNEAFKSTFRQRHGAILIKGGRVINRAYNENSFCSFSALFRDPKLGEATRHAEARSVYNIKRNNTKGATIYVCRINAYGKLTDSRPCDTCQKILQHVGIKRVVYSLGEKEFAVLKL